MDFIERLLGVSPDGGSGTLEILLLAASIATLYLISKVRPFINERGGCILRAREGEVHRTASDLSHIGEARSPEQTFCESVPRSSGIRDYRRSVPHDEPCVGTECFDFRISG